jgi:hypothetical protein
MDPSEDSDRSKISVRFFWKFLHHTGNPASHYFSPLRWKFTYEKDFENTFDVLNVTLGAYIRIACDEPQGRGLKECAVQWQSSQVDSLSFYYLIVNPSAPYNLMKPRDYLFLTFGRCNAWIHIQTENSSCSKEQFDQTGVVSNQSW